MNRLSIGFGVFISCTAITLAANDYIQSIQAWQQHREEGLRKPDSWLTLVGLFWLKEGDNTIGSDPSSDLVLPKGSATTKAGRLRLHAGTVTYINEQGATRTLSADENHPDIVNTGSVSFYAIQRNEKVGVRAKDSQSQVLKEFRGTEFFPIDPAFHMRAKLIPDEKTIQIHNVIGQIEMQKSPGVVEFAYRGQTYRLRPIFEGKTLFFLFKDPTNRVNTYQAGRMVNTPLPVNNQVDLDLNRSYNPPCTFTPYATCPLPPKENTLPFPVLAGEKRYGKGRTEVSSR